MSGLSSLPARCQAGRQLGGVCSGLAEAYGADVRLIRAAFIVAAFINGLGLVAYLLLWAFMRPASAAGDSDTSE